VALKASKMKEDRTKVVLRLILLINLALGVGSYKLPSFPKQREKLLNSLEEVKKLNIEKNKKVYLTGHLLPQLPYHLNYKRIFSKDYSTYWEANIQYFVIGKWINSYPFNQQENEGLIQYLLQSREYEIFFEDENLTILQEAKLVQ